MTEKEYIWSELISGGLKCHFAFISILREIVNIIIAIISIVINLFDLVAGIFTIVRGFFLIARLLLDQDQKKEKERMIFI